MRKETVFQKILAILAGLGVLAIGIYMIRQRASSIEKIMIFLMTGLLIFTIVNLITVVLKTQEKNKRLKIIGALVSFAFGLVLFYFRLTIVDWVPSIFAAYIFITGIIKFISATTYWRDGVPNYGAYFINAVLTFVFSIFLFFNSYFNKISFALLAGGYFIWYGITLIFDVFNEEETQEKMSNTAKKFQRKLRIAIPPVLGALLPMQLLKKYDKKIASEDANAYIKSEQMMISEKAGINPINVEILVHLSKKLMESFGHVDLIFGNSVISYGNFDHHSYRLGGIMSDGILFTCNKKDYLYESVMIDKKVLFSFKVNFTKDELEIIKDNYDHFKKNMYEWYSDVELEEQGLLEAGNYTAVEDKIYQGTKARFYKFKKGPLKTYFALSSNCVKVADSLFENTGFDKPATGNIVTPGAYYQFLMGELERPGTKVYEKKIYSKETFEEDS